MWNAPDGLFEKLIALALIGAISLIIGAVALLYFVATNVSISWGM